MPLSFVAMLMIGCNDSAECENSCEIVEQFSAHKTPIFTKEQKNSKPVSTEIWQV